MQSITINPINTTPISIHSETYSTRDLGSKISEAYRDIEIIKNVYLQIHHDDIRVKIILNQRATDDELNKLIDSQLIIHEKFNYSFSFDFDYILDEQFIESDFDDKIL